MKWLLTLILVPSMLTLHAQSKVSGATRSLDSLVGELHTPASHSSIEQANKIAGRDSLSREGTKQQRKILQLINCSSSDTVYYRLENDGQVIEALHITKSGRYYCIITNYIYKVIKGIWPPEDIICSKSILDSATARAAFSICNQLSIQPDGYKVKGWGIDKEGKPYDVLHGSIFLFYSSTPPETEIYWPYYTTDTLLSEYKQTMALINKLYETTQADSSYETFQKSLKPGNVYTRDGYIQMMILGDAKNKKHRRIKR